jgi:hypothetical protein
MAQISDNDEVENEKYFDKNVPAGANDSSRPTHRKKRAARHCYASSSRFSSTISGGSLV